MTDRINRESQTVLEICSRRMTDLLPQPHHLEALEIGERPPPGGRSAALGPGAVIPLLLNLGLLPRSLHGGVTSSAGELVDHEWREGDVGERRGVAGDNRVGIC